MVESTDTPNAGRFTPGASRAREAGRKGGLKSSGRFKPGAEAASAAGRKGGLKSPGKFTAGSERAREAGRKGGQARRKKKPGDESQAGS